MRRITKEGRVIAFDNFKERHRYLSLTCRERAIKNEKPGLASKIVQKLRDGKQEEVLSKISLEAGVLSRKPQVLDFISKKISMGESIFLDFKEEDAKEFNQSHFSELFLIASIYVTPDTFEFLNPELFSIDMGLEIIELVERSQGGALRYLGPYSREGSFVITDTL